jgi:hypothetical protein
MIIKLARKNNVSDKQPLIVNTDYDDKAFTKKLALGETLDVEDQLGYQIMSQYPNMFEQIKDGYKTKVMQAEASK